MKTPTNFIPIIGPLYADDLHKNVQKKNLLKPLKRLTDQPNTRWDYSTVTDLAKFLG